jgi:hypothetical protein
VNINKLIRLESDFLHRYPQGFNDEEMQKAKKKHKVSKVSEYLKKVCSKENMKLGLSAYDDIIKVVSRSSMVSVFEKMGFRDLAKEFDNTEKYFLLESVYELIHGNEEKGFNMMISLLEPYKLAKWPIITVWRAYWNLDYDVFVKPTTVKKVISYLELEDIKYTPKVNYEFYVKYRIYINELKKHIDMSLKPNNPAFSGFLMMTIFD